MEVQLQVVRADALGIAGDDRLAVLHQHRPVAEAPHGAHVVRHEHDRPPRVAQPVELVEALLLERRVADGEHLVDQQHVGVDLDHHREREPDVHPRRVVLELHRLGVAQLGEVDHLLVALARLHRREAEHDPVEDHVVARREVRVEADAELDERRHPAVDPDLAARRLVDAGDQLEQRALARAVAPDDAEELALLDREGDVADRVEAVERAPAERVQRTLLERVHLLVRAEEASSRPPPPRWPGPLEASLYDRRRRCGGRPAHRVHARQRRHPHVQPAREPAGRARGRCAGRRSRSFEVIVVNGPSTDGTGGAARVARRARSGTLDNPERNLSRSRNLGIAAAAGELVAFLDDDAVPEPRWLEELVAPFADERVAGAGGLVLDHTGVRVQWRHLVVSRAGDHDFDQLAAARPRSSCRGADPFLYVAGGNSAFRRAALVEIERLRRGDRIQLRRGRGVPAPARRGLAAGVARDGGGPPPQPPVAPAHGGRVHRPVLRGQEPRLLRPAPRRPTAARRWSAPTAPSRACARRRARRRGAAGSTDDELAHHLGRADAGFHVGLRRAAGADAGRRRAIGPPPAAAFLPYPTLAPSPRRRVAVADAGRRALARRRRVTRCTCCGSPGPSEPYRIDVDDGVWVHAVPVRRALAARARRAAAPRAARGGRGAARRARARPRGAARSSSTLRAAGAAGRASSTRSGRRVAALLRRRGASTTRRQPPRPARLLDPTRFPTDHEPGVRALPRRAGRRALRRVPLRASCSAARRRGSGAGTSVARLRAGEDRLDARRARSRRAIEARGRGVDPAFVAHLPAVSVTHAQAALRAAWLLPDAAFARTRLHVLLAGAAAGVAADAAAGSPAGWTGPRSCASWPRAPAPRRACRAPRRLPPEDARTRAELRAGLERLARLPAAAFAAAAHRFAAGPRAGARRGASGSPRSSPRGSLAPGSCGRSRARPRAARAACRPRRSRRRSGAARATGSTSCGGSGRARCAGSGPRRAPAAEQAAPRARLEADERVDERDARRSPRRPGRRSGSAPRRATPAPA